MSKRFVISVFVLALCLCGVSAQAFEMAKKEFSADQYTRFADGSVETSRLYVGDGVMRMEEPEAVVIVRPDLNKTWIIDPAEKAYYEMPFDPEDFDDSMVGDVGEEEKVELGRERLNGYECTKYRVTVDLGGGENVFGDVDQATLDAMPPEIRAEMEKAMAEMSGEQVSTVWEADELGVPIRSEDQDGSFEELRNIQEGSQPSSLFELPSGLTKRAMPAMAQ